MPKSKIAISIDKSVVGRIDSLVSQQAYSNRSQAIEEAVASQIDPRSSHGMSVSESS